MWYIYVVCALLALALIIYIIHYNKEKQSHFKRYEEDYLQDLNKKYGSITAAVNKKTNELKELEHEIDTKKDFNESLRRFREQELDRLIEEQRDYKINQINAEVCDWARSAQEAATEGYQETVKSYERELVIKEEQLKFTIGKLAEYQSKFDAVNKEILRRRAIEEKNEFYRVQLTNAVKEDIEILNEIRPRLSSVEIFNKFIYDNYISRPTKEMVQRVLVNRNPSGIYKVTNIQTHESYIGKSVKIADRWQNHIKAALGLGGVAESQFQRALKKYGVDNFTWEVIEEVGKDELTEREKYWITFYDTKTYGYNQREG